MPMPKNIIFKRDPYVLGFAAFLILLMVGLVVHKDITWKEAGAVIFAAVAAPGVLGLKSNEEEKS